MRQDIRPHWLLVIGLSIILGVGLLTVFSYLAYGQSTPPSLFDDPFQGGGSPFWGSDEASPRNPMWATPGASTNPYWGGNDPCGYGR